MPGWNDRNRRNGSSSRLWRNGDVHVWVDEVDIREDEPRRHIEEGGVLCDGRWVARWGGACTDRNNECDQVCGSYRIEDGILLTRLRYAIVETAPLLVGGFLGLLATGLGGSRSAPPLWLVALFLTLLVLRVVFVFRSWHEN